MGFFDIFNDIVDAAISAVGFVCNIVIDTATSAVTKRIFRSNGYGGASISNETLSSQINQCSPIFEQRNDCGLLDDLSVQKVQKSKQRKPLEVLEMEQLPEYPLPEEILAAESNQNLSPELLNEIDIWSSNKSSLRKAEQLYIDAYKRMIFFEEAAEHLKIKEYNQTALQINQIDGKEFCIFIQPEMKELCTAIDDNNVYLFNLISVNQYGPELNGRIKGKDKTKIYIDLFGNFKKWNQSEWSQLGPYDIHFQVNRSVFQLQHNALNFIQEHDLFYYLINNPMYHKQIESTVYLHDSLSGLSISNDLNYEQRQSIEAMVKGSTHSVPYLLYGPPGTGKTKVLVAAIEQILKTTRKNILICAQSNAACDEIAERLYGILDQTELYRMYSSSYKLEKISSSMQSICNLFNGELKYPSLKYLYTYRVLICTLSTSGCLTRARHNPTYNPDHFGYVFIDECASAHETMALIPIAGLCTSLRKIHAKIILAGDPKQLDAVTKSDWSTKLGFKISWFEQLFELPLYQRHASTGKSNNCYMTQLVKNYRSHAAILKIPNKLFYDNTLEAKASPDIIDLNIQGLRSEKFPIIFKSVQGVCRRPENETSSFNMDEVNAVIEFIKVLLDQKSQIVAQSDIGVVTPYKLQCRIIHQICQKLGYNDVTIGTSEVFQGQERKVMIISTVRTGKGGLGEFLSNAQRMNVMITRAKCLLIVVGDPHMLAKDLKWLEFIIFCFKNKCLIQGKRPFSPYIRHTVSYSNKQNKGYFQSKRDGKGLYVCNEGSLKLLGV